MHAHWHWQVTSSKGLLLRRPPCLSLCVCLPACSHCNDCRELDLCRDASLQHSNWDCPVCSTPYDRCGIESRLVAALQARLKEFALQDLTCTKCKQVGLWWGASLGGRVSRVGITVGAGSWGGA